MLTGKRSCPLEPSFNDSNESSGSSDSGHQEEKDLLLCFQGGEKAGEEISFCPKVTSESDDKAYGSDVGGLTSSSDDAKISSTNSTSSEDGASSTRKSQKRHLESEQEGAAKKKIRCDSDGRQVHEKIALLTRG